MALLAASPRSAKRDRGCQPGTGRHKGCLGPSPEQRKGARSLALPCLWVSCLLWVPSTWLVPGSRLGARRLLGSALAQPSGLRGSSLGLGGRASGQLSLLRWGRERSCEQHFLLRRGFTLLLCWALVFPRLCPAAGPGCSSAVQRAPEEARAAAGELLLHRLPPSSPSQGVPGDEAPPGCSPRPPLALQGGRGAQQPPWEGLSALQLAAGRLAPPAPAAGAGLRSLLHLAWVPECFGKALTPDPQYKLSPARGREKLLPDLQAPGFTSCLQ